MSKTHKFDNWENNIQLKLHFQEMQLFYYEINTVFDMWEKMCENNTQYTSVKRLLVRDIVWVIEYWKPIFHNKMSLNFSQKVSYNK